MDAKYGVVFQPQVIDLSTGDVLFEGSLSKCATWVKGQDC